jgi:3-deoxy-manno-octulosonate cytidylyltransferase (CMP-KDO synthetase)
MNEVRIVAIIPARMASSRYPGKPLIEIEGLPMIEHVRRRALLCSGFSHVAVATCDPAIRKTVEKFGGAVIMTSNKHIMASDRVAEAIEHLDCTHVVNVQGDEILVLPEDLELMIKAIKYSPNKHYWNATAPIEVVDELADTTIVKCAITKQEKILYCARDFSALGLKKSFQPIRKILGVLGYSCESIKMYSHLPRTPIEISQSIDQSRIIENSLELHSVSFSSGSPGINEPREEEIVKKILKSDRRQKTILNEILN